MSDNRILTDNNQGLLTDINQNIVLYYLTPTPTPTCTVTATPPATQTPFPTRTVTATPTTSISPTPTLTPTETNPYTGTPTPTKTYTITPTQTPSQSPSPTPTINICLDMTIDSRSLDCYSGDGQSGDYVRDLSIEGNNSLVVHNVGIDENRIFTFTDSNNFPALSTYFPFYDSKHNHDTDSFTVSVVASGSVANFSRRIVGKGGWSFAPGYFIKQEGRKVVIGIGSLSNNNTIYHQTQEEVLTNDSFKHILLSLNASTKNVRLYVNGNLQYLIPYSQDLQDTGKIIPLSGLSIPFTSYFGDLSATSTDPFAVGSALNENDPTNSEGFNGLIAAIKTFDCALGTTDVQTELINFHDLITPTPTPTLTMTPTPSPTVTSTTYNIPATNVCVSFAGSGEVNGTYELLPNNTYFSRVGTFTPILYFGDWYNPDWQFYKGNVKYTNPSKVPFYIPTTGWVPVNGSSPAPLVALGVCPPSQTPTQSVTYTLTPTVTRTPTSTPNATPTNSPTITVTPSFTPTITHTQFMTMEYMLTAYSGAIYLDQQLDTKKDIVITFEYSCYGEHLTGGEGFCLSLVDSFMSPLTGGGPGPSLGYSKLDVYRDDDGMLSRALFTGIPHGVLGIGFDLTGMFSTSAYGLLGYGIPRPNTIAVRGPTNRYYIPEPIPSGTPTPTGTPVTPTPTITSVTPTPTPTMSSTRTPQPTFTPTITMTNTASGRTTPTPTTTATVTNTVSRTSTLTPTQTPTISVTASVSPTATPTLTITQTATLTVTPTVTLTPGMTQTITSTPTNTPTPPPTQSVTATVTDTPTNTPTTTMTGTPTVTPTRTVTLTPSMTPTFTQTSGLTPTPTPTMTMTHTALYGRRPTMVRMTSSMDGTMWTWNIKCTSLDCTQVTLLYTADGINWTSSQGDNTSVRKIQIPNVQDTFYTVQVVENDGSRKAASTPARFNPVRNIFIPGLKDPTTDNNEGPSSHEDMLGDVHLEL